jgi:hypothetical protein
MRLPVATGIALALAALAGDVKAREVSIYRGPCGQMRLPAGPRALPAPVKVDTRCGTFIIDQNGVRFGGVRRSTSITDGLRRRGDRLELLERGRVAWRSARRHPRHAVSAWVATDDRSLAFQYYGGPLYLADFDGRERPVGTVDEYPLGWTRIGVLVTARGTGLRARTRAGRLVEQLTDRARSFRFDEQTRTLLFVSRRSELVRTDGRHTAILARLSPLGVGRGPAIEPLRSGRIAVVGRRLVVLDPRGGMVASDRARHPVVGPSTESPRGAVASVITRYLENHTRAREAIRLLRPGARASTLLFAHEFHHLVCGHGMTLSWRGGWLLYSTTEGHVVAIDAASREPIDLTTLTAGLPGRGVLVAGWA